MPKIIILLFIFLFKFRESKTKLDCVIKQMSSIVGQQNLQFLQHLSQSNKEEGKTFKGNKISHDGRKLVGLNDKGNAK